MTKTWDIRLNLVLCSRFSSNEGTHILQISESFKAKFSWNDVNLLHWHWVVYSLVTQGCLSPLVEDLDEDVDKPGGEAATTLLLLVVGHHLLLLLHGGGRLQQALSLLRLAQPLEHTVLQLSAPHSLQRQNSHHVLNCRLSNKDSVHVICRVSFLLLPIFKITKMKNELQPTIWNSSLLAEQFFYFSLVENTGWNN